MVDRQDAAVKLAGALDAADHAGRVDEGIDADVTRPRALGRRHPVQREAPLEDLQIAGPERERSSALRVCRPAVREGRRDPAAGVESVFVACFGVRVQASSFAPTLGAEAGASLGAVGAGALPDRIEPKRSGFGATLGRESFDSAQQNRQRAEVGKAT